MTDEVPPTKPPKADDKPASVRPAVKKPRKAKEGKEGEATEVAKVAKVVPLLRAYFRTEAMTAATFAKAVSEVKSSKFADDDVVEAEKLREANDLDHRRLLALATLPSHPPQISHWLWPTVRDIIRRRYPHVLEPYSVDVDTAFRRLHRELSGDLTAEVEDVRKRATVILQLGLAWMALQRNLDFGAALQVLGDTFAGSDAAASRLAQQALTSGKMTDIHLAVAISTLTGQAARQVASQRDQELLKRVEVQEKLDEATAHAGELKRRITELEAEVSELRVQAAACRSELDDSRQHWGHDMVEVKTRQATLLQDKVVPMLSDAVDALEIDPAQPKIALRRIRAVLSSIKETEA